MACTAWLRARCLREVPLLALTEPHGPMQGGMEHDLTMQAGRLW